MCSSDLDGVPLLEIRERSEVPRPTVTTKIFESGAWTVENDGQLERGCFDRKELRGLRRAVYHAPWKLVTSPIACFAHDPNFTEYVVDGTLRFTAQMCSGKAADATTQEAITLIERELADERAAAPPPQVKPRPPVKPPLPVKPPVPACRADGTPLFEIRKRSDIAAPTSTIAIYATGAWTFQPLDASGHAGAATTGCLDRDTLGALRGVIEESPWDTTYSRIVCRAYSPSFTEYYVHGRLEYTARMCGAQRLDEQSLGAIQIVEGELAKRLPPTAATP